MCVCVRHPYQARRSSAPELKFSVHKFDDPRRIQHNRYAGQLLQSASLNPRNFNSGNKKSTTRRLPRLLTKSRTNWKPGFQSEIKYPKIPKNLRSSYISAPMALIQ